MPHWACGPLPGWRSSPICSTAAGAIPGTGIRFGADALLSLLPGLGPVVSTVISGYLIWEARRLGVSTGTVLRMIGNVGLDGLISAVPVAGAVGDVFFRANRRNMALLRKHLARGIP